MGSGDRERVRTSDKREWLPTLRPFAAESYIYECCVRMAQMDLHECNVRKYEWDLVQQTVNVCIDETKNPVFRQSFFFTTPTHPTLTRSILPSLLCVCVCRATLFSTSRRDSVDRQCARCVKNTQCAQIYTVFRSFFLYSFASLRFRIQHLFHDYSTIPLCCCIHVDCCLAVCCLFSVFAANV